MNVFDGAVRIERYTVRASGPNSLAITFPTDRGFKAGDKIDFFARADEPEDWIHIRKASPESNSTNNKPESKDGCNGMDDRQPGC